MRLVYSLAIRLYFLLILIASVFNHKAGLWIKGRKKKYIFPVKDLSRARKRIWIHCASLGEFEQGRPIIEELRAEDKSIEIFMSFFSPSGFEIRKNYSLVDGVFYLPLDTVSNVKEIIEAMAPDLVIIVKYEFWYNLLYQLKKQSIPYIFVSATFRKNQHFFKWYGRWFLKHLVNAEQIFVQDEESKLLLAKVLNDKKVTVAGDTRFDRVMALKNESFVDERLEVFSKGHYTIVAGSTWPEDEKLLFELLNNIKEIENLKLIIAPHEISLKHIDTIINTFRKFNPVRFSELGYEVPSQAQVMVIDSIGLLSKIYRFGKFAYIGGGFGAGIHNILEAAVYGLHVAFGPNHKKFREAIELDKLGIAHPVNNEHELKQAVILAFNKHSSDSSATMAYMQGKSGATATIKQAVLRIIMH